MKLGPLRSVYSLLLPVVFLLLAHAQAVGQVTMTAINHNADNQAQITVTWNGVVGAPLPPAAGFTARFNPGAIPVAVISAISVGATTLVTIASAVSVGQTVQLSWVGSASANAFGFTNSVNNRIIICADFNFQALIGTDPPCVPVNPATKMVFSVKLAARNSSNWGLAGTGFPLQTRVDWGPVGQTSILSTFESTAAGVAAAHSGNASFQYLTSDAGPDPFTYTQAIVGAVCGYTSLWRLRANGGGQLPVPPGGGFGCAPFNAAQNVIYTTWNTENGPGDGTMVVNPFVANSDRVCLGSNVNMRFVDNTDLNCVDDAAAPGALPNNNDTRWIRVRYGIAGTNLPNVVVGGVAVTDGAGALLPAHVADGGYINKTGSNPYGVPDAFGVVTRPASVTTPAGNMELITTSSTAGHAVGQRFYVELQYWNVCNAYDGAGGAVTPPRLLSTQYVEIIAKPVPATAVNKNFCQNEVMSGGATPAGPGVPMACTKCFEINAVANTEIKWYTTLANATADVSAIVNDYGTQSRFLRPIETITIASGGTGPIPDAGPAAGDTYSTWVRYRTGVAPNNCLSDPVEVRIVKRETLAVPTITSPASFPICSNTNGVPFTTTVAPAVNPLGGAWNYTWSLGAGALGTNLTINPAGPTSQNMTLDIAAPATGAKQVRALRKYTVLTTDNRDCASANGTFNFNVDLRPLGGTLGGGTTPICLGSSTGVMTLAAFSGTIIRWEVDRNGLGFNPIANTLSTYSEVPALSGTYTYRVVVGNGVCAQVLSTTLVIVVNANPTSATLAGGATICQGNNTNLTVTIVGGASPYTINYTANGTPQAPIAGYISGSNISVSPAATTTYALTSVTDANGCAAGTISGTPVVTISNPASATLAGTANICPLASTNLTVTIAGGAGASPYTVNYTANGVPQAPVVGYISGNNIVVSPAVTTTYVLTSVTDSNGCPALSLLPAGGVVVTVGSVPTSATFAGGSPVCLNQPKNLTLTITGGVSPYQVTVTPSAGPVINLPAYVSGSNIPVPTTAVGSIDYNVTFVSDACGNPLVGAPAGNPQTVVVNPFPVANNSMAADVCSQTTININPALNITNGVASTFAWTAAYPGGLTGGAASGAGNINTGPLVNLTGGALSAVFTVTPTSVVGTCVGPNYTITQPVNPQPVSTNKPMTATCSNVAFSFNPQTLGVNAAGGNSVLSGFTWTVVYDPGLTVVVAGTGTGNVAETLQNLTGGALNATYTITPRATTGNCLGNTFTFTVPINPQPVSLNQTMTAVCSGSAFSFNPQTVGINAAGGNSVPSTFTWTAVYDPGLTGGVAGGAGNVTGTLTNTTAGSLNAVFTVTPTSVTGSCVGNNFTITVPINAQANVTAQPPANTVSCATDLNVTIAITATGPGLTFQWQERIGAGPFTNIANGTFGGVTYAGATANTLSMSNVQVAMNSNQYRVILTTTGSCTVTSSVSTLTVNPLPTIVNQTPSVCSAVPGGNQQVVNLTSLNTAINAGAGVTVTITWFQDYNPGTRVFSNPIAPGPAFGQDQQYQVTNGEDLFARVVTNATGCINSASAIYTVRPMPFDNQIKDGTGTTISTVATSPATYNICASGSSILFQTDDLINPGSSFSWTIPPVSYPGEFVTVTASANILVMRFPNPTEPPAGSLYNGGIPITVTETLNGCPGNPVTMMVHVLAAPAASVITGDALVCENATANYSVPFTAGSTYSWTLPVGAVITSLPVTANAITVQMGTISGNVSVVESNGTCLSPPAAPFPVTVATRPVISTTVNPICSGANVNTGVSLSATIPGSTFNWVVLSISGTITGVNVSDFANGVLDINQTPVNTSGIPASISYQVTPIGPGASFCPGTPTIIAVTVNAEPVLSLLPKTICAGVAAQYEIKLTPLNLPAGTRFSWAAPTMSDASVQGSASAGLIPMGAPGTIHINDVFVNNSAAPITATYTISAQSGAGCNSTQPVAAREVIITINPLPVGANITRPAQCSNVAFNLSADNITNGLVGNTFTWVRDPLPPGLTQVTAGTGSGNIAERLRNLTAGQLTATYVVTPVSSLGCTGATYVVSVPVNPEPVGADITRTAQCSNVAFSVSADNITNGLGGTSTYAWVRNALPAGLTQVVGGTGTGAIAETLQNLTSAQLTATYTVTPTSAAGCVGATYIISVPVNPQPVGANATKTAQCSNVAFSFNPQLDISNSVNSTFTWTAIYDGGSGNLTGGAGSGTGVIAETLVNVTNIQRSAVYTVTPTSVTGTCLGANFTITVPVNPHPVGTTNTKAAQCSGVAFSFNPQVDISNGVASTFSWTAVYDGGSGNLTGGAGSGTGTIAETLVNITGIQRSAVYTVTPTATTGSCVGAVFTITVPVNPQPVGTNNSKANQCSDVAFSFDPQNDISNGVASTFTWTAVYDGGSGQLTGGAGSGTGLIAETLTNVSGLIRNAVYTVTPRSTAGLCFGSTFVITVPVRSEPVGANANKAAQCSGVAFSFNPQTDITNTVASTFAWTAIYDGGSGNLTGGAGAGTGLIAETLVNLTGGQLSAVYTVTPTSSAGSCVGTSYTITVPVNPQPVGTTNTKAAQCSGVAFSFNPQLDISNGVASTFAWTAVYDGGSGNLTGGAGSGTGTIAETLVNVTAVSRNAVYTVTPTATTGNCVGAVFTITVPVNPQPVGATNSKANQCSDVAFSFDPQGDITNGVASTFTWTASYDGGSGQLTGGAGSGIGLIAETLNNVSGATRNAVYTVIPRSAAGLCFGASFVITVPVRSEPVGANATKTAQCSGVAFSFNPQTDITNSVTSTFAWTAVYDGGSGNLTGGAGSGTGLIAETLVNLTGGPLSAVYTVTPTSSAGGCVGTSFTITVPVNPQPVGVNNTKASQCSGVAFTFNPQADISNGVTSTFSWTAVYDGGSGQLTGGLNSGTGNITETLMNVTSITRNAVYTVIPTATTGSCVGASFTITVPVNPQPVGANNSKAAQCSDVAFSFDPQGDISNGVASTFTWTAIYDGGSGQLTGGAGSGTGLIAETLNNVSGATRNAVYTVTPRSSAGLCFGANFVITVPVRSEPVGMPATKAAQCSGVAFSFNPQTDINNGVISTFAWTAVYDGGSGNLTGGAGSGTGALAETLTNLTGGTLNAVYTVTPTSSVGTCVGSSFNITIPITSQPVGANSVKADQCSGVAFSFNPQVDITNGVTSTFAWTAVYDGGSGQLTGGAGSGTGNVAETLINVSSITRSVVYTVTPTSSVGSCTGATFTITVPVDPQPVGANITRAAQCSNVAFSLSPDNITNGLGATSTYTWVRNPLPGGLTQVVGGTGSGMIAETLQNLTSGQLSATYVVTPTSADGCVGATYVVTIPVNPEPVGANITLAAQCSNVAFNLSANNITNGLGGTSTYAWVRNPLPPGLTQIVGGASGSTIAETLENLTGGQLSATYVVTPTSAAGCVGLTYVITIPVNPEPVGADITRPAQCSGVAFNLSADNISNGLGGTSTYTWVRNPLPPGLTQVIGGTGTGAIAETLQNLTGGQLSAIYVVTPTSASGCTGSTYQITVPVNPAPVGVPTTTVQRCSGDAIAFDLNTLISNAVPSVFRYTVVADFPLDLSPSVFPGTFDRTVASNALISETFSNYSNHDVMLTYTVTPISDPEGCTGANFTLRVVYHPEPVGANLNEPNCNTTLNHNIQTQITNGVAAIFTYTVASSDEFAVPTPPALDRTIASAAFITDSYTNLSGSAVTVTYTIQAFNQTFPTCASAATFTYSVTIAPKPVGVSDTKPDVCSDVPFSVDPQNNIVPVVASTSTWTATYDGSPIPAGSGVINASFTNTSNAVKNAIYTITPTAVGTGCVGDPFTITIPIQPEPVIDPVLAVPFVICSTNPLSSNPTNVVIDTNGSSIAADSYIITLKSQDAALVGTPTTGTFPAVAGATSAIAADTYTNTTAAQLTVVYTVVPVSAFGCLGNAFDITVQVNPEPVLSNPGFPAVCSTNTSVTSIINVVLGTNGTSVSAASYELMQIQYSTGGPFGGVVPPGLTPAPGNTPVSAAGDINLIRNDKYTNTTAGPITIRYTIQGTSASGCRGGVLDYDIVINPEPTLDPLLNPTPVCSGVASNVTLGVAGGSVAASTYNINSILFPGLTAGGSNTGIGNNKLANAIFNDVYVNTTNGVLTATYKISPVSAAGCVGPEGTVTLTINPSPDLSNSLNRTVCINSASGIVFSTTAASVAALNYNLISVTPQAGLVPAGGNVAPANGVGTNYVSADQFNNPTNGTLTVAYRVEPVSGAACLGPQEDIILTVEPTITAAPLNFKPTVCSGSANGLDPTDIELISPTNPSAGVITFNYTAVSSIGTQITGFAPALNGLAENFHITDNLVNSSNAPATVTYTITPVASGAASGAGCTGIAAVVVVTVEPKPRLTVVPLKTVCEGVATAISLTSTTTPSVGTIEFELISATPTGGVTGATAPATIFANGGTLNDILSNPTSFAQTVTYIFRPRFNGGAGCVGDDVQTIVTVNPRPVITATPQADICDGGTVNINLTSDVAFTVPTWVAVPDPGITGASNGAGDMIFQILFNNTTGTGPLNVRYDVTPSASGCAGNILSIPVVVNPLAKVVGTPPTALVCHGGTLNIPLNSNVTAGVSYSWTVVDSSGGLVGGAVNGSGPVINQAYTNTSGAQATLTYTISPVGPGGCPGQDKLMIVTSSPEITTGWLNADPEYICNGSTAYLILQIGGRAPFAFTYNEGGGPINLTGQPPVAVIPKTPSVNTTYTVTSVTDGLGCTTPFAEDVTINVGDTDATFSIITPTASCSPNAATFQYNQVAGVIYTWRFGDTPDSVYQATTTVPNMTVNHTYTNLSPSSTLNYPVTMQTELPAPFPGCFDNKPAQTVTIYPNPILNVVPNRTEICSGESITFTNSSVGTSAATIQWSYRVQGQIPETIMGTTFNMTYTFTNTTTANPIIYEVIFRASNAQGCDPPDIIMPIEVYRYSIANFNEGTVPPFMNGESLVTFTNISSVLDATAFQYDWVFGADANPPNSAAMAPGTVQYVSPGPKEVTLTVTNLVRAQCSTTFTKQLNIVLPPLVATFDVNPKAACFPAKISVDTNPAVTVITGDIIEWEVLDQNNRIVATSSGVFPEFSLPTAGVYTVTLRTASSQTGQEAFATPIDITIYDRPFASFDARPDVVFVPDTEMTLFNFSADPDEIQFTWDFGDGDVLIGPNPTAVTSPTSQDPVPSGTHNNRTKGTFEEPIHVYKVEGIYDITLITSFDHGGGVVCRDTLKQQVQGKQGGVTKVPNAFTPNPNGSSGGSGQGSNGSFNDVFLPIVKGAVEYNLQIYDRWGNLIFESNNQDIGWDGFNVDGKPLPAGVYVYKLTVLLSDGQRSTQVGDVTMIR